MNIHEQKGEGKDEKQIGLDKISKELGLISIEEQRQFKSYMYGKIFLNSTQKMSFFLKLMMRKYVTFLVHTCACER